MSWLRTPSDPARGDAAGFGREGESGAAPGIDRLEITDAALHTWGLDEGENAKPALILRVDSQQSVSRGRGLVPREPLWAARPPVNLFLEPTFALTRDPRAPLGPIPPVRPPLQHMIEADTETAPPTLSGTGDGMANCSALVSIAPG